MKNFNLKDTPFVLLDDSRPDHKAGPSYLFHSPATIITALEFSEILTALEAIDTAVADGLHVAGWIAYECALAFEPKLSAHIERKAKEPLIWMMATQHRETLSPAETRDLLCKQFSEKDVAVKIHKGPTSQSEKSYTNTLHQIHEYIRAGDVYQINHTMRADVTAIGHSDALYQKLRTNQPVAYGAYIHTGENKILSLSPELFLQKQGDLLTARPMKGTAPRGNTAEEDRNIQQSLKGDAKSQAENLMIVDLIRNDLSRIAQPGSVSVPILFEAEQYSTLHQMTSTVTAKSIAGLTPSGALKAMFPCGSVTGAPKVRAIEIIQSLESSARGIYCGAIGYFSPQTPTTEENWCLNVPIRTVILDNNMQGRLHVGSGIVADSDPADEYRECLLKAAFIDKEIADFSLIETMGSDGTEVCYLERHLLRLKESAQYFDFRFSEQTIRSAITAQLQKNSLKGSRLKIRLLLDKNGVPDITITNFAPSDNKTRTISLSDIPTNSSDPYLFHKTTNRFFYDTAYKAASAKGHADVIFMNERGDITEGAISSIFVKKSGVLYTPPLNAGLLPGILRAELLATRNDIQISTLTLADLKAADTLYIGSALRGLRRVKLAAETNR